MSSVASDRNEFILKQVCRYQRRALTLVLFRTFVWSGTILIAGKGLSRFKIPYMLVLMIFISCLAAAYYLWYNYPRTEQVVRIIDDRLSLKEGLVTAFQFRGSERPFVPLLIRQVSSRLTGARPRQIFSFKMPGVLLAWPFLLILMIVPAKTGPLRLFSFHQYSEGSAISSDSSPSVMMYPLQQGVPDNGGMTEESETSFPGLLNGDENHMPLRDTKEHENVMPAQAGIQNEGRSLDSHLRGNDGELGGFSAETLMPLQGTKELKDVIPAQTGIQNDGRGLDSHFRGNDGDGKEWIPTYVGMTDAVHSTVVQILARRDIPLDYKEYVKNYFDVIQKEGLAHGEE